jgi:hypothetical protein
MLRINRGTAGALDRVAQIAERKYCRPQARPFRLGFPRKVPVFRDREGGDRSRYCGGVPGPAWIRPAARQSFVWPSGSWAAARQAGRRDDEGGPQRRGGDSQTVVACAGCGRPLGHQQPRRIHAPLRVKERHPSERQVGDSSTSPFHMLSHDLPLLSRRYGRDLPLACGSSYITHIMPKASAA